MRKKLIRAVTACCLLMAALSCRREDPVRGTHLQVGEKVPEFSAVTLDGKAVSNRDLLGKPSVIVLFDSTCPDCQRQMPAIQDYHERSSGTVSFLAIARKDTPESAQEYWENHGYSIPVVAEGSRRLFDLFDRGSASGVPQVYLCDASGTVTGYYDQFNLYQP